MHENDERWMRHALALAKQGEGAVEPNPMVGAVIVRDGECVGEGWHARFGGPHAEVVAFQRAGEKARGATLYVTLEPCCHHGKTPPCTEAVLKAGIRRVVAATLDPFPQVAGRGIELLQSAGVDATSGLLEDDAKKLLAPYLRLVQHSRPWVHAKWAMSLDGKIATNVGESKWITNEHARAHAHGVRGRMDAIAVGIGTVLADDPLLTARPAGPRTPVRVVFDRLARTPPDCRLVVTSRETPTMIVVTDQAPPESRRILESAGCEVLVVCQDDRGRPNVQAALGEFGKRRWTNLLVEGGGDLLGAFASARVIDEAHVYIAPLVIGGRSAVGPVGDPGFAALAECLRFDDCEMQAVGDNFLLHVRISPRGN